MFKINQNTVLSKNQDVFNILFEAIPEGIIIVDEKQHIVTANAATEKMFGYHHGELTNKSLNILVPTRYQTTHKNQFNYFTGSIKGRKNRRGLYLFGLTKNNLEFPIEIALNPFALYEKEYIMALVIDMTIRRETEIKIDSLTVDLTEKVKKGTAELQNTIKQLKEVNRNYKKELNKRIEIENKLKEALRKEKELYELKSKFLSLVSHEFKTPLSGILTSAILLEKYQLTEQQEKRDKHLKTITDKVQYLNNILNDFISLERLDSSNENYKFKTFNLSKVINEVVYNANMLLKCGQHITIPDNASDYVLHQDEKILENILSVIIYNAIKYSPENSEIDLEISKNTTNIIFTIKDQGMGIPKNDQKFVYNRYFRGENVLNIQGTGIGLNIVKEHLKNLGGTINFTSTENKGSVFFVELPINNKL
ncbi:MAG: PAS domain-containing sensor histidine kinase [Lutibacter sp.]|nr:PAS domain-containing sensor histidine kinase [Lutibacter sp.]MDT8417400.1 PAS domain-containing sensor histidine kinase [Lutibacter sp.]